MANDAHVHFGHFPRLGYGGPFFYTPRRILHSLNRAGVDQFIASCTDVEWDRSAETMHKEALELKEISGSRAHIFFWVSMDYLKLDKDLAKLPDCYEGVKLHGGESPWLHHPRLLNRVLAIAKERNFPVQIHTGKDEDIDSNPMTLYLPYCKKNPDVRFDLAHGQPEGKTVEVMKQTDNIWVDTAFVLSETVYRWLESGADENRIMYGSDIPAPKYWQNIGLSSYLRREIGAIASEKITNTNMLSFLSK